MFIKNIFNGLIDYSCSKPEYAERPILGVKLVKSSARLPILGVNRTSYGFGSSLSSDLRPMRGL